MRVYTLRDQATGETVEVAAQDFVPQAAVATGAAVAAIVDGAHGMDSAANFLTLYNKVVVMEAALLAAHILKP